MKTLKILFFGVLVTMMAMLPLMADNNTVVDDVLLIPYAFDPPQIDGILDDVWAGTTAIPMLILEDGATRTTHDYADLSSKFRVMWDEDNLYIFLTTMDDSREAPEGADPWNMDNMELFLDGGNEKQADSYDDNDVQWRWVWGATVDDPVSASRGPGDFAFHEFEGGYNLEIAIPVDSLTFPLEDGHVIGFEISNKDVDDGQVEQNTRWWTTDPMAWTNPASFGTAKLVMFESSDILSIYKTTGLPEIDGIMDFGEGWEEVPEYPMEVIENDTTPWTILSTWEDHHSSFWITWDDDNLYIFLKVVDDSVEAPEGANPWDMDNMELFIDGGNEKQADSYDDNDVQWRWVWGATVDDPVSASRGPGDFVILATDEGYNIELAIPKDSLTFPLEEGQTIGFEISCKDVDMGKTQINKRWWTTDPMAWTNPASFGTAILKGTSPLAVAIQAEKGNTPRNFELKQNYPNPFNPSTVIEYSLEKSAQVRLTVYNVAGQLVAVLVNQKQTAGNYQLTFDASHLPSGVYFYKLSVDGQSFVRKMVLTK